MVNKNSSEPLYLQIACILRGEMAQHQYATGGTIGTHSDLAKRFGVSLITVRKAIELLTSEGLLISTPGKGTFVKHTPLQDGFNMLTGMSTVIAMNNMKADVAVSKMNFIEPPSKLPKIARMYLGERCLHIERTHSISGDVIGLAFIYIPDHFAKSFSIEDVSEHTIYYLFEKKLNIRLGKGVQYITATPANTKVASILGVVKNSPLLMLERFSYSYDGQFLEYMQVYYEYSKYSFQVELDLSSE